MVEGLGSLARFTLTGGEAGDSPEALPLLRGLEPGSVSADKAYDSDALLDYLKASNIEAVIPPRSNRCVQREFDKHRYKSRNLVERFFCRIKQFRRIATRYCSVAFCLELNRLLARMTFWRMSRAHFVQIKGLGWVLW